MTIITGTIHALQDAIAAADVLAICATLDRMSDDVLAANYTEGRDYNTDVYDVASRVYAIATELLFGVDAEDWRHNFEHGAADHRHAIASWFASAAADADDAAEMVRCVNADHADGFHAADRYPNETASFHAANVTYWRQEGCAGCQ